jgi:hypothetical protein
MFARPTRYRRIVVVCAVFVLAAAAAVTVNILLLARTSDQTGPVVLTQHVHLPAAPAWTIRPAHGRIGDQGADD